MKGLRKIVGKFVNDFLEAVIFGTFIGAILFYIIAVVGYFMDFDEKFLAVSGILLLLNVLGIFGAVIYTVSRSPHRCDSRIIGNNFAGPSGKDRLFRASVEKLMMLHVTVALDGFKKLEADFGGDMPDTEKALVSFYTARCYDTMGYHPNALRYYDKAQHEGFDNDVMKIFRARCVSGMGDVQEALRLYNEILTDENNMFGQFVRTDIGKMYLARNDAENALKWFSEAMEKRENYADALGGAAVAQTVLRNFQEGEELCRAAVLNKIDNPAVFLDYFKSVQAAALVETQTKEAKEAFAKEAEEYERREAQSKKEE